MGFFARSREYLCISEASMSRSALFTYIKLFNRPLLCTWISFFPAMPDAFAQNCSSCSLRQRTPRGWPASDRYLPSLIDCILTLHWPPTIQENNLIITKRIRRSLSSNVHSYTDVATQAFLQMNPRICGCGSDTPLDPSESTSCLLRSSNLSVGLKDFHVMETGVIYVLCENFEP